MNNCNPTLKHNQKGIKLINRLDKLKHLTKNKENDLFIANWSLSEFPLKYRKQFISTIKNSKIQ